MIRCSVYMRNYLYNRKERVKVNDTLNTCGKKTAGMVQEYILGLLLFNNLQNNHFDYVRNFGLRRLIDFLLW